MKKFILLISLIILFIAGAYWYFFLRILPTPSTTTETPSTGFIPLNRPATGEAGNMPDVVGNSDSQTVSTTPTPVKIPSLRLLSNTPVGGYGASTTPTVTIKATKLASSTQILGTTYVRWVDRGRGNVYEADEHTLDVKTLSNTVLPRVYMSAWNKDLTAFIGSLLQEDESVPTTVYAELRARPTIVLATSTSPTTTASGSLSPYELKGKNMPENIIGFAVSPKKDKVFMMTNETGYGVGYTATIDGKSLTRIFSTPLTQVNVDWPEENTIAITTKGSATFGGFLYFVNPKTGTWKKILGPFAGLSAKVSHDAKYAFVSVTGNNQNVLSSIYNIGKKSGVDAVIRTIADKCAWGNFYKDMVYCGVPSQPVAATYPDDWYIGSISTIDKIWQVNATTAEVKLISSIVDQSDRVIDAFNLGLDEKDNYLFFMSKNDLSLWSLDLVASN